MECECFRIFKKCFKEVLPNVAEIIGGRIRLFLTDVEIFKLLWR